MGARESAHLRRARSGRERRVHHVDVKRDIRFPAPQTIEEPARRFDPVVMDLLGADHRDPMGLAELKVLGGVHGPPDADLHGVAGHVEALFQRPAERRPVEVPVAEVLLPHILVAVEMHQRHGPVCPGDRAEDRERNRVIASDARRHRTGGQDLPHRLLDPLLRVDDVEGIDVDIPAVRDFHLSEWLRAQHRVIRPD